MAKLRILFFIGVFLAWNISGAFATTSVVTNDQDIQLSGFDLTTTTADDLTIRTLELEGDIDNSNFDNNEEPASQTVLVRTVDDNTIVGEAYDYPEEANLPGPVITFTVEAEDNVVSVSTKTITDDNNNNSVNFQLVPNSFDNSIAFLLEKGIVQGYPDGTFREDNKINRAEFLKIVMRASVYEEAGGNCFNDVTDQWFAPYVCKAKKLNLVQGYEDGNFRPEAEINFGEASKIVSMTLHLRVSNSDIGTWYQKYIDVIEKRDAVPFTVTSFDHMLTRGEMAEMITLIIR